MTGSGFTPDLERWDAWRPDELAPRLRHLQEPWAFAAGWAIDLFLGGEPRSHDDLEIVVRREGFPAVQAALPELEWFVVGDGAGWPLDDAPEEPFQTWGRERSNGLWRIDVFRDRWDGDTWVCRRNPAIRRPLAEVIDLTETQSSEQPMRNFYRRWAEFMEADDWSQLATWRARERKAAE